MNDFNVGDMLKWNCKFTKELVPVEYRGKVNGLDWAEACVIVREDGKMPYQCMVKLSELQK